jgi:hypothetical protein
MSSNYISFSHGVSDDTSPKIIGGLSYDSALRWMGPPSLTRRTKDGVSMAA